MDTILGGVELASFDGTTWNTRLNDAFAWVKAERSARSITPPILLPSDEWSFSGTRALPDGLALVYPFGIGEIPRSAQSVPTLGRYEGSGPAFTLDHTTFGVYLSGLTLESRNGGTFFDTMGNVLWTSTLRDLGGSGWKHFLGNPSAGRSFLNTACSLEGRWHLNNMRGQQVTLGGSDTQGRMSLSLSDVGGGSTDVDFRSYGGWQWRFDYQEKGTFSGFFMTCQGNVRGIYFGQSRSRNPLFLTDFILEGRNADQPCTTDLLRVTEGTLHVQRASINHANKPTTTDYGAPVVVESGGTLFMDSVAHKAVPGREQIPLVYVKSGGEFVGRLGSLVGEPIGGRKPVVVGRATSRIDVDSTFTVVRY
jgi:hypothetical protein